MRPRLVPLALLVLAGCTAAPPGPRPVTVVVLGSSTAAGGGPRVRANGWVERYRRALRASDGRVAVYNLAVSGYTTFKILPTGTPTPAGMPTVDTAHNVSAALRLHPDAVLVNMPSNDRAYGISVAQQLANFEAVRRAAAERGVAVWFTTGQPRNLPDAAKRADQRVLGDSLRARYGGRVVDFWTGLATADDRIDPRWDAGDGVHLGDSAHALLAARALAAGIPAALRARPRDRSRPE